jgi:hypothetical protein
MGSNSNTNGASAEYLPGPNGSSQEVAETQATGPVKDDTAQTPVENMRPSTETVRPSVDGSDEQTKEGSADQPTEAEATPSITVAAVEEAADTDEKAQALETTSSRPQSISM